MEKLHRLLNEAFEHNRPSNKVTFPRTQVQLDEPENSAIDNQRFSHDQKKSIIQVFFISFRNFRCFLPDLRIFTSSRFVFIYQQSEKILETE